MVEFKQENFIELETKDEANKVDLNIWTFIGLKNNCYVFKRRVR